MVVYRPQNTGILYATEDTWGTEKIVTTALQGKVKVWSGEHSNNLQRLQGLGEGRNQTTTLWGPLDVSGNIELAIGRLDFLKHGFLTLSGAGTAASPYLLTETDTISSFTMQAFTDESTDFVNTYAGCVLNSIRFSISAGAYLSCNCEWRCKTFDTNTTGVTYSADTTPIWNFSQCVLKYGSVPTVVARVIDGEITINQNCTFDRTLNNDRFIQEPIPGKRTYDFTFSVTLDSSHLITLEQGFLGQANSPHAAITDAGPSASEELQLYFEGPTNQKLWIQLDDAFIDRMSLPINVDENQIRVTFGGHAENGLLSIPLKWQISA